MQSSGQWRAATVAVKQMQEDLDEKALNDFKSEAEIFSKLRPHVLVKKLSY